MCSGFAETIPKSHGGDAAEQSARRPALFHRARSQDESRRRDESSRDLSPLFRGLCGRSMKPEGCFSSRHAEAALWSEQSTTRRLFGKEQSTTQSRQMMGRKMHRSVIFRSQCLSSKLAYLQEVRKQYHCFQMPVRSFDDPFMWSTGLAHCRWKALTNSTPGKHQQIRNKRVCQRLKQSN